MKQKRYKVVFRPSDLPETLRREYYTLHQSDAAAKRNATWSISHLGEGVLYLYLMQGGKEILIGRRVMPSGKWQNYKPTQTRPT